MGLLAGTIFDRPPRCPQCDELEEQCRCPPQTPMVTPPGRQTAKLTVEKRKKGKIVTVISGLSATENDLPALLTRLKTICGAGGTISDGELEVQGSHLDRVRNELQSIGYKVRG